MQPTKLSNVEARLAAHPALKPIASHVITSFDIEVGLARTMRWSHYQNRGIGTESSIARRQTTVQHIVSISFHATTMIFRLIDDPSIINIRVMLMAFPIHDIGEVIHAENGKDVLYHQKSATSDYAEFQRMQDIYASLLPAEERKYHEDAFLLQFAAGNSAGWPDLLRVRLKQIALRYPTEMLLFEIIERWDYLMYAMEQFLVHGNTEVVSEVIFRGGKRLDELAELVPNFCTKYWTPELSSWCWKHLEEYPLVAKA
jgi:hypothetical protein